MVDLRAVVQTENFTVRSLTCHQRAFITIQNHSKKVVLFMLISPYVESKLINFSDATESLMTEDFTDVALNECTCYRNKSCDESHSKGQ